MLTFCKMPHTIRVVGDGTTIATVSYEASSGFNIALRDMVNAALNRRNRRGVFMHDVFIPTDLKKSALNVTLERPVGIDKIYTFTSEDRVLIKKVGLATKNVVVEKYPHKIFRKEMAAWVVANDEKRNDGMAGFTLNMGLTLSKMLPAIFRTFNDRRRNRWRHLVQLRRRFA
jgi:hypothetical protein